MTGVMVESLGLKFSIPEFIKLGRKIWQVFVCVCLWLDLSCFVGIEKHLEISGDAYVSLLHSSANKALGNYWNWIKFCSRDFFYNFLEALGFFQRFDLCSNLSKIITNGYKFSCSLGRTTIFCLSEFLYITLTLKLTMGK